MRMILFASVALVAIVLSCMIPVLSRATEANETVKVTGTIKNVDAVANSITLETSQGKKATYTVDAQTTIQVGGKAGTLADLKVGQTVMVEIEGSRAVAIEA
jgi:hypothetical protein